MRFAHPEIETVFTWPRTRVPVVVIEDARLFRRLVTDIRLAIEGEETPAILSVNDKPIGMAKYAELLADFLSFPINRKPLLTKVSAKLEQKAVSAEHFLGTQELLSTVETAVEEWAFDIPCDITVTNVTVAALLKAVGLSLREEYDGERGEAEKVLDYMELVREFDREKLFITVNMRSWFSDEVIADFMATALSHEYRLLMLESSSHPLLEQECRTTVDRDLCEF